MITPGVTSPARRLVRLAVRDDKIDKITALLSQSHINRQVIR